MVENSDYLHTANSRSHTFHDLNDNFLAYFLVPKSGVTQIIWFDSQLFEDR